MLVFAEMLQGKRQERIIHIPGSGGIGKTRLLQNMRQIALETGKQRALLVTELLDFYNTILQTDLGLIREIVSQLGDKFFSKFERAEGDFRKFQDLELDPVHYREEADKVIGCFFEDFANLCKDHQIVMLFDTCEEMHGVEDWFINDFLVQIEKIEEKRRSDCPEGEADSLPPATIIALAGREEHGKRLDLSMFSGKVKSVSLGTLSFDEAKAYYHQDAEVEHILDENNLSELYKRTGGHPLYVALSFDWLKNEVGSIAELLDTSGPFGAELVDWVRRLGVHKKLAILCMALAWRRMEIPLLVKLLGISEQEVDKLVRELSKFSFIKYRLDGKFSSIHLHDEMRRLVNEYIWPKEQESRKVVQQFNTQILDWYVSSINNPGLLEGSQAPADDRQRALLAEWLYYQCQVDLDGAMKHYEQLFRKAIHHLDMAFCEMLNQEVGRFVGLLSPKQRDELLFRQALTDFRNDKFPKASNVWNSLLATNRRDLLQATTLMLLVELESYTGKPDEAIKHAQEAEKLYKQLRPGTTDPVQKKELIIELGQLYNNWGYACRVKGNFKNALDYYRKALKAVDPKTQPDKHRARVLNNMGYIYFKKGDVVRARSYVGRALSIREKIDIPYELGLGYNTMGMIIEDSGWLQDAVDLYHKAYLAFEEAHSERGKALAMLNQGRINRVFNDYNRALQDLGYARGVFEQLKDKDYLIVALNELGCTYRQRREENDLNEAIKWLEQSLELSREMGKYFEEVDNLEDISTTYFKLVMDTAEVDQREKPKQQARQYAMQVINRVDERREELMAVYLRGKAESTLGDLEFIEDKYTSAFDHYFESCCLMAKAWAKGHKKSVFLQRQYEDSLNRMQEQLHALETSKTLEYAMQIEMKLGQLPTPEKRFMSNMKEYLRATRETTYLVG
jgi:tetratricopeptide (TPR) repeat protein